MADQTETEALLWNFVALALALPVGWLSWNATPLWLKEIPFVWMVPVFAPMGFVVFLVAMAHGLWVSYRGPESDEERFAETAALMLLISVALCILTPFARAWQRIRPAYRYIRS